MNKHVTSFLLLLIPTAACWWFSGFLLGYGEPLLKLAVVGVGYLFAWVILLNGKKIGRRAWIIAGFLLVIPLSLPGSWIMRVFPRESFPFDSNIALTQFLIFSAVLFVAGMLLNDGISQYSEAGNLKTSVVPLLLSLFLFAKAFHTLFWLMVWDSTTDPLSYFWLGIPIIAVLFTTLALLIFLPGKAKMVGVAYLFVVPAMMVGITALAQQSDFRQMTEERAERVRQGIDRYYERNGRYPQELSELTPWTLPAIPEPLILYGETWCYENGGSYYSLGYVTRDHWSDPRLYGRVFLTKGDIPNTLHLCDKEINAMRSRYPDYYGLAR